MTSEHATPTTAPREDVDTPGPTSAVPVRPRSAGREALSNATTQRGTPPLTLDPGLLIALVGGVLGFLAAFLTWASTDARSSAGSLVGGGTVTRTGLQGGHLGLATLVLSLVAIALVVLIALPATRPWGWIALAVAGALTVLLAVLDAVASSAGSDVEQKVRAICGPRGVTCVATSSTGVGVWLTMIAGLVVAVGAVLHHRPIDRLAAALPRGGTQPSAPVSPAATATAGRTPVGTVTRHPMTAPTATPDDAHAPSLAAGAASPTEGTDEEPSARQPPPS